MGRKRKIATVLAFLLILVLAVLAISLLILDSILVHDELLVRSDSPNGFSVLRVISREVVPLTESLTVYIGSDRSIGEPLFRLTRIVPVNVSWEDDETVLIIPEDDISPRDIFIKVCIWKGINIQYEGTLKPPSKASSP